MRHCYKFQATVEWFDVIQVSAAAHTVICWLYCHHHWQSGFKQQRRQIWGSRTLTAGRSCNAIFPLEWEFISHIWCWYVGKHATV